MYPQNITRHIYACEKCYRDHPFLPRGFSTWHKFQRAAEPWCSCVVPCSCAWSWFTLFGSHSQRGTCHPTAQFSAALASLQPLGRALRGLETTLPYFPFPSSPYEGEAEPTYKQVCSTQQHSTFLREAVCRFFSKREYLVEPAMFLCLGSRANKLK